MRIENKLDRLQRELPEGLIADSAWMQAHGYSSALRSLYVSAGWLDSPARRVYRRSNTPLTWQQVVISLKSVLDLPLVVGGRTALEQQGYAHYLSESVGEVHLIGPMHPPTWLDHLPLDARIRRHNSLRLFPYDAKVPPETIPVMVGAGLPLPIRYSSKGPAVLELLDELPEQESFHRADALLEGLSDLSAGRLQTLLEAWASVKVKRLFLFFADRHRHAWLSRLDTSRVNFGAGKRALVNGGKLDARYSITVPADLVAH